jgi:hypothetical protein
MALGTTDQGHPDGWLGCRLPRRQKEEKEEPWPREAADCRSDRRSGGWGPKRAQQAPSAVGWKQRHMSCAPQQSPQRLGVPRDNQAREAHQRATRAVLQGWLPIPSSAWQGEGRRWRSSHRGTRARVSVTRGGPQGRLHWRIRLPRKHGRGWCTTAHHRSYHRQHAAAPCSD